jgi:Tfp pilus assembly protein PilF
VSSQLHLAIQYILAGDVKNGGKILTKILKANPQNEVAWLWMSRAVALDEQARYCLRQVLSINPHNEVAQKRLSLLEQQPSIQPVTTQVRDFCSA